MKATLPCQLVASSADKPVDTITIENSLKISFHRTVRVADNQKLSCLPPDLGAFPLFKVSEYDKLPPDMKAKGGLFFPMYQKEAMWIRFKSDFQFAIKVYLGEINAISSEPAAENFATQLRRQKLLSEGTAIQDYIVTPQQLWLDGIAVAPGKVRQFVAVHSGTGFSVESQITGMDAVGGIQIEVVPRRLPGEGSMEIHVVTFTPPKRTIKLRVDPEATVEDLEEIIAHKTGIASKDAMLIFEGQRLSSDRSLESYEITEESIIHQWQRLLGGGSMEQPSPTHDMGLAAGGLIKQTILQDKYPEDSWNIPRTTVFNVQILNSAMFQQVTGLKPPPSPISLSTYANLGLPFFDMFEEDSSIHGSFSGVQSIAQINQTPDQGYALRTVQLNPHGPKRKFSPYLELVRKAKALPVATFT